MHADYSTLEPALAFLKDYGPDLRSGLTSHAPMVVEALSALGRPDAVQPWLDQYRDGLLPRPTGTAFPADAWREALGRPERTGDWNAFFEREVAEHPWRDVLTTWTVRLAPGICASATHGVLRVGHCARSLLERETPARVRELGDALASWAAWYQTLPTAPADRRPLPASDAVAALPIVPEPERRFAGTIVSSLEALADFAPFGPVIGSLDVTPDPAHVVSELTERFARVFLANVHDTLSAIVFVHSITSLATLRGILPVLDADAARQVLRFGWQSSASLYAAFASTSTVPDAIEPPTESPETLADMAIAHGDEHAIKLTEACLREHAIRPASAYLAAAKHAITTIPRP